MYLVCLLMLLFCPAHYDQTIFFDHNAVHVSSTDPGMTRFRRSFCRVAMGKSPTAQRSKREGHKIID